MDGFLTGKVTENGFYGDWEERSEDNEEFFDSIMAEIPPVCEHTIESYEEFLEFVEKRKDDKKEHYFAGDMDCFNNEFETIEDIRRGVEQYEDCASWPGECFGPIYEW